MAATIATMAMHNATTKCLTTTKPVGVKPMAILNGVPKGISISKLEATATNLKLSTTLSGTAIAGAVFSTLSACDPAFAAQQIAEIAEGDNRGLALLLPIVPAIGWVLFNILQPALNQINRMTSSKGVIVGLGLGLGASGLLLAPEASATATEVADLAEAAAAATAASSDSRGTLLLFVVAPAILWVLYNILQPALNQINRMRN